MYFYSYELNVLGIVLTMEQNKIKIIKNKFNSLLYNKDNSN